MREIRERTINAFIFAVALFFPFSLLLAVYPLDVFVNNLSELRGNIATILPLLNAAAVAAGICLAVGALLAFLNFRGLWTVAALGLYLGLYIVVGDLVAPLAIDKHIGFDGAESILQPPAAQIAFDVIVFLVLTGLFFRFRNPALVKIGATFAAVFLAMTIGGDIQRARTAEAPTFNNDLSDKNWKINAPPPTVPADHPNVYHLVLDGFQGGVLPRAMELAGLTAKDFDGFSYFPKNRSNYDGTQMSFPSFMSGTIYRSGSMKEWYDAWYKTGMWSKIKEVHPTNLQIYSAHQGYINTPYNIERKLTIASGGQRSVEDFAGVIFHLSLVRVAPSYFHKYIFRDGTGMFSREREASTNEIDPRLEPFRLVIDDEPWRTSRGQYVFMHIFVPHSPFLFNERCSRDKDQIFHYRQQSGCVMRYVNEFLIMLRRLGRYDESIILIHSDHGWGAGAPIEPLTESAGEARVQEMDMTERIPRPAKALDTWTAALLMVKPPGSSGAPMVTSRRSTQLVDIPNSMYDMLSMGIRAPEGMSVLSEDYPESVERHVYPGFRRWDRKAGKQVWVGKEVLKGELNHFSWTSGKGWKAYPNMPFSWE